MKRTILIIEDDIIFSRSISNWLKKKNIETECVTHLSSARRKLSSGEYDLVLADLRLPDGNSTELLRWIHEKHLNIPLLIMTNYGQIENAVEAMLVPQTTFANPYSRTDCWSPLARFSAV